MKDKKDMSERLKYFRNQKDLQNKRKYFYLYQLLEIEELIEKNKKEIIYNEGWVKFHEKSIADHKKIIDDTFDFDKKKDQEFKLQFHMNEINNHQKKNIDYHNKEINDLNNELQLFKVGIKRCDGQIKFIEERIKHNLD